MNEVMYGDKELSQDKHVMLYWAGCARERSGGMRLDLRCIERQPRKALAYRQLTNSNATV